MSDKVNWDDFTPVDAAQPATPKSVDWSQFEPVKQNKGFGGDVVTALKQGVQQLPGIATGLADIPAGAFGLNRPMDKLTDAVGEATGFQPSKWAKEANQEYSTATKEGKAKIDQAWDDPNTNAMDVAGAYLANPRATVLNATQSVPAMLAGGAAGKVIGGVAKLASGAVRAGIGEGAVMAGSAMDQINTDVDPQRAAGAALATGVGGGLLGYAGGRIAQRLGITDVDALTAGGTRVGAQAAMPMYKRIPAGMAQEGLVEEAPQSAIETAAQNWAEGNSLTKGMARHVTEGALAGGLMGGIGGALPQNVAAAPTQPPAGGQPTAPGTPPLQIGNTPDPMIGFADGTVARQSEVDRYINSLPPEQQPAARAKLMGLAPQPSKPEFADILDTDNVYAGWSNVRDGTDRQGMRDLINSTANSIRPLITPETPDAVIFDELKSHKWFNAATPEQKAAAVGALKAMQAAPVAETGIPATETPAPPKPSEAMGLAPTPTPSLTNAAIVAVDSSASQPAAPAPAEVDPIKQAQDEYRAQTAAQLQQQGDEQAYNAYMAAVDQSSTAQDEAPGETIAAVTPIANVLGDYDNMSDDEFFAALGATPEETQDAIASQPSSPQASDANPIGAAPNVATNTGEGAPTVDAKQANLDRIRAASRPQPTALGTQMNAVAGPGFGAKDVASKQPVVPVDSANVATNDVAKDGWQQFTSETGTLNIPRAEMPQVKNEHRGAMVNFLNARGVEHEAVEVDPANLKPTQAEFSPEKVASPKESDGKRAILISSDNHIIDGHHQALAKLENGEPVKAIRLDALAVDLIPLVNEFPSSTRETMQAEQPSTTQRAPLGIAPEAATPAADTSFTSKQIPDMTDEELQQAKAHYPADHKRAPKITKEINRRALVAKLKPASQPTESTNEPTPTQAEQATQEGQKAPAAAVDQGDGINDSIRALRAKSFKTVKQGGPRGDVRLSTGGEYVSFDDAVAEARKAVASGVRPVPFQIHNALDVNIGETDRIIAALGEPVVKPVTPQVAPAAAVAPKKGVKAKIEEARQARADYFTPGNIVRSFGGQDEVLRYTPPKADGSGWSVKVHAVKKVNGEWVRIGKPQDARTHSTQPDASTLKAGPVDKAKQAKAGDVTYTEPRADGTPFPNADARGTMEQVPIKASEAVEAPVDGRERNSPPMQELGGFKVGDTVDVMGRTTGRSKIARLYTTRMAGFGTPEPMATIEHSGGKMLDLNLSSLRAVEVSTATQKPQIVTDKAEMRPYRKPDGSVGYEAVPIRDEAPVEPAKPYRPSKEASTAWNAALERYALNNYHESGAEQRAAFGEGFMRAFDGAGSNPNAKHIADHVDGVLFFERTSKDEPVKAKDATPAAKDEGQNDELDAEMRSYEAKANPTYDGKPAKAPEAPKPDTLSDKEKAAKAKMFNALGKLAALAGKNTRMNWTPEEEQQLLPIVIELFDGAMELGSVTFQKAVRYVREFISANLDQATADAIPFETLQGAYIHTARKFKDQGATTGKEVMSFDSLEELETSAEKADTDTKDTTNDQETTTGNVGRSTDESVRELRRDVGNDDGGTGSTVAGSPSVQKARAGKVPGTSGNLRAKSAKRVSGVNDFTPGIGGLTREGSWFESAKRNIDLIELAIKIESENRAATPDEQAQLAKYVGFGASAIRNDLFPVPPAYAKAQQPNKLIWPEFVRNERFKPLAERIEALPREWQQSILQSSQYAHYTSEGIIRSVWSALQRMGFTGGNVFEPGMGIGSFAMLMPNTIRNTSRYTGVEFDAPTALIARLLSPDQNMIHGDFIKKRFPENFFDVNVGNPPFSQTKILGDPKYAKNGFMLHDFFFAKGIDLVRPGGIQVFVTSKGTMDKQNDKARKYLSDRADLLGAIRLPSTAFEDNAGTSVVTDVIFLRKRLPGEQPAGEAWGGTASVDTKDGSVLVNEYFAKHPEMVLGQQRISGNTDDMGRRINSNGMGGEKYTVVSYDTTAAELDAKFAQAIEKLPENAYSVMGQSSQSIKDETAKIDFDPSVKREGVVYAAKDGTIMRVEQGVGKPLDGMVKLSDKDKAWFKGYVSLRDLVQESRFAQLNDGEWEKSLAKLNKAHDAFIKEHGHIQDFRVITRKSTDEDGNVITTEIRVSKNKRLFSEDYDRALVTQIEDVTEDGTIVKAPFLKGRTIGKPVSRDVRTIGDALAVSLDEHGTLNLDDVAQRMKLGRDEVIDSLGSQIYQTPTGQWQLADEYLAGDVVAKLEEAEQAARLNPALQRNVEALKAAQPEKLGPSQISAKLGASWIPESHVNEFSQEIGAGEVTFDPKTESWTVQGGNERSARKAGAEYGTAKRSPSELLEAILNSRSIKITQVVDKKTVQDEAATTAANEMAKKIKDKFKGWVWTDTNRASELVESYNHNFNNIAPRRFDGSHLTLPGVSLRYKLHPHQLRAIWRQIQTGNTYLAHAVGAGKTIEMIAGGMEQRRLGLIKKPMYVVPNHMLEQFSNEFMELYPLANIMVADDENFSADRRKAFIASATLNNPDAIIITHDAFQRIGVKEESVAPIRDEILADLEIELSETAKDNDGRVRRSQLQQQIEAVTQRFDKIIGAGQKDSTIKFEDMGVDFVFADEAHTFRKLDFHTAQSIKGIDPNGSKRALDMYVKTRILEKNKPGRSFTFASGTPVTNTMGELYTIMRFFAGAELDKSGISTFDAWARQFGEVVAALEPNAAGAYQIVERFAKFDNVPELMSRVRQFMDVLTSDNLGALVKRPDLVGGKPNLNIIPTNAALTDYMKGELARRIEISKAWKPSPNEKGNPDPIVSIITDGRFAAIDPRFFGGALQPGETSIITEMGDSVAKNYHATKNNVYTDKDGKPEAIKGSTQIVFYNLGFGEGAQRSRGFNARDAFTKRLTDGGIPRHEIAWFDDANTDAKKESVFKDMRSGKLKVLIGSAKKMGTGVNVQKRLGVLHYQDPPWFPADVEQPHGRIIRQGNQNGTVAIEWYTTKGTYQSTMWQMVGRKQRFIDQAFTGDKTMRSMDDLGEASLFEQAAAVASGDPRAIQLAGLKQDVERFERLQAAHASEQISVRTNLRSAQWSVESLQKRINQLTKAFKAIGEKYFSFTSGKVGGTEYAKVGEFGQAVKDAFNKVASELLRNERVLEKQIASVGDVLVKMDASIDKDSRPDGKFDLYIEFGGMTFQLANASAMGVDVDAVGLARRIFNQINSVSNDLSTDRRRLVDEETDSVKLSKKLGAPFEYQQEMAEKYGELKRLEAELKAEGETKPDAPLAITPDGEIGAGATKFSQGLLSPASFGPKPTPDQIKGLVDKVLQISKNIVPVSVIGNPSQITGIQVPVGAKPKGALINGRIYLFSDNIRSFGDAYVTLFHELFHLGLQKVIPAEDYATMLRKFARNVLVQKYVREWKASPEGVEKAAKMPSAAYEALATEEAMAMISEELSANDGVGARKLPGLVKTMLSWFAGAADRLGFPVNFGTWMRKLTQNNAEKFVTDMVRASMGGDKNLAKTQAKYGTQAADIEASDGTNPGVRFSQGLGDTLASAANNVRDGLNKATVTDLKHQFGNRLSDFRGLGLQTLGRRQLVDLYAGDLPQMEGYSRMVAQMDADKNESGAEADALATDWGKLKDERQLAELMHDATLAQIDPDKAFVTGDDRNFYDALKHGFDLLTPEAKTAYRKARDMYSAHNDKVRAAIRERIMRSELSSAKKQALLTKMDGEFFKKVKGVYFPLARFGQYVTIVKDSSGNVLSANRSETMNEAEATRKILLAKFPASGGFKVGKVLKDKEFNAARDGVGRGFMADLFETLDKTNAGEELIDSISQLYLAALPDLSWAKHGIHRKGTPGFSQDARRAFAQNMFHGARYLAKLRYADQLQTGLDDMQKHVKSKADVDAFDSVKAQQVVDEMVKRHDSMMNPAANPISTALTSFGFVFHLGLSPASALVNLSQTALVAYPVMGAKWGFGKASAALLSASRQAAGNKNDISKVLAGEELEAYNEAVRAGVIDVTMAHDLAGIAQGEDSKVSAKIRPVMKAASFLFHHAEKFNRQVTFVAAYRLAKEAGAGHQSAYDQAVKATYDGHFDYSASNRPRVMQGNVAKVVLLFKQYAQNMIYTLTRQAQLSLKAATPAERAEARKALGGLLASHAMAAGVFGLPMVGMLLSAASAIGGDDDEPWDAKVALQNMLADTLGQKPAEVFAHGLSRLTPWDISGRVGLDKLLLPDIQEGLEGADAVKNWMAAALGPVAGIAVNAGKGMQDIAGGQYARGLESMLPSALRAPLKAYRYGTEGNIDKTGVAINDEIGSAGVAGQALGFSPSEARLAQEGKSAIYSADRKIQERRSSLVRQFAMAAMAGDSEGMADVRQDIARFNEKNPKARVTPVNLMQSVRARRKRIEQAEQGVYLPKKRQDAIDAGRFAVVD